jgi:hypothetical protein
MPVSSVSVVLVPVVLRWSEGPLCWLPVVDGVERALVMRSARRAESDRRRSVVQIAARYAARGRVRRVEQMAGSLCRVIACWCGMLMRGQSRRLAGSPNMPLQRTRVAREIVAF